MTTYHIERTDGQGHHTVQHSFDTDSLALAQHWARTGATVTPDLGELGPYRRPLGPYTLERLGQSFGHIIAVAEARRRAGLRP
jgi:hypothetical protein